MIERVAAAIAEKYAPAVDQCAPYAKVMVRMAAQAAIEALRDPTDEMMDAGNSAREASISAEVNTFATWHAMIDVALKEPPS